MLTRTQKETEIELLKDRFSRASSVFLADYRGLDVESANGLRKKLKSEGEDAFEYRVAKNTLLRRAVEGSEAEGIAELLSGPTAVAFSFGDAARLAKILVEFSKENEVFEIKGGLLDGKAVETEEIATLATLPSLEEVRGMLAGLLVAPAGKIARVLAAPGTQLARLLDARRGKLEESGDAA